MLKENITLYFADLLLVNTCLSFIFLRANFMLFNEKNNCAMAPRGWVRTFYNIFVVLTALGYAQLIYCMVLAFVLPLHIYIMYKLIDHRLNRDPNDPAGDQHFLGGLMQIPLPIPEILSQLSRSKYGTDLKFTAEKQCAICWADFQSQDEVTPLMCDNRHLFHTSCIEAWIRNGHNSCPMCRKPIANI